MNEVPPYIFWWEKKTALQELEKWQTEKSFIVCLHWSLCVLLLLLWVLFRVLRLPPTAQRLAYVNLAV